MVTSTTTPCETFSQSAVTDKPAPRPPPPDPPSSNLWRISVRLLPSCSFSARIFMIKLRLDAETVGQLAPGGAVAAPEERDQIAVGSRLKLTVRGKQSLS